MSKITSVEVVPVQEYISYKFRDWCGPPIDQLPTYDNTKLVAINTCPLWGILRYTHHRTMSIGGRSMALEAGAAAHEVFAAHRLYTFAEFGHEFFGVEREVIDRVFRETGLRLFGEFRFEEMVGAINPAEDFRTRVQQFALTALYNCGFCDDPFDKKRTVTNVEEMCLAYMDKYDWRKEMVYWDGANFLGIEVPVDVVIRIVYTLEEFNREDYGQQVVALIRFIGKADALHYSDESRDVIRVHENKTASRLGDAWEIS